MKGLHHYWRKIWILLEDKLTEHATLLKIVFADMSLSGQANKQIMSITREIEVKKLPQFNLVVISKFHFPKDSSKNA